MKGNIKCYSMHIIKKIKNCTKTYKIALKNNNLSKIAVPNFIPRLLWCTNKCIVHFATFHLHSIKVIKCYKIRDLILIAFGREFMCKLNFFLILRFKKKKK